MAREAPRLSSPRSVTTRVLLILVVVAVFGALMVIDTAALIRLGFYCVTGGCGVRPLWLALAAVGLATGALLMARRSPANVKNARVKKAAPRKAATAKTTVRTKPKRAKQASRSQ